MGTTTSYGTWVNHTDGTSLTLEQSVEEAFGSEGPEGFDVDAIITDYRDAINKALPEDLTLAGSEFYGPYPHVDVDIAECVASVDLWPVIESHATSTETSVPLVVLYEDNAGGIYLVDRQRQLLARPDAYTASFMDDAQAMLEGDTDSWLPTPEPIGQGDLEGVEEVARWVRGAGPQVALASSSRQLRAGSAAAQYLGLSAVLGGDLTLDAVPHPYSVYEF